MRRFGVIFFTAALGAAAVSPAMAQQQWAVAVHGGAGGLPKNLPPEELKKIQDTLRTALETAGQMLEGGQSSLDAVEAAVKVMENSCVLNAGCGAVLGHEGFAELDAAIMNGKDRAVGSVAAVHQLPNPIAAARLVMEKSPHVLLVGDGAEKFAVAQGLSLKPREYFITARRKAEWQRAIDAAGSKGTVGAVALDKSGNLAAATSTGGMTNKAVGRVGDAPIIGAGTYAENGVCAVSATGHGEYFIRYTVTGDICARVKYKSEPIDKAARMVIDDLAKVGGTGGVIALDAKGNIAMPYSTPTMIRGHLKAGGASNVVVEAALP
ncbi:MAG: isoaspartyl peptidase/L-asparaginase [Rhodospirillaceae bacterium]|nr:isoaspartyl peptidase/L-asparaginase [Rhodospirillaceae bacterium]